MSENWDIEPDNSELDDECEKAVTRCWEESEMKTLAKHLGSGKSISSEDLSKILRVTLDAEIPSIVRLAIADLLDPNIKTGRHRRNTYFESDKVNFRNEIIRLEYTKMRVDKISDKDAMESLASTWHQSFDSIRSIIKSKNKS